MISNLKIIFIFIFSFSLLSCMGGESSFDSSTEGDTITRNRNNVNSNPQNAEDLKNNSRSITERFNDLLAFFTESLPAIVLDNDKTTKEKRDILKEFQGNLNSAIPEYEVMKSGVENFKQSTEARKTELKCDEDIADRKESEKIECEKIAEDLEEVEEQESYYTKIDCYVEKTNKFKAIIDNTLNSTNDNTPSYMISVALINATQLHLGVRNFDSSTLEDITRCETDEEDNNNDS